MEKAPNTNSWNTTIANERVIWSKYLTGLFIIIPEICKKCNNGHINLRNKESLINPYLGN